jgi:hypothetical protein
MTRSLETGSFMQGVLPRAERSIRIRDGDALAVPADWARPAKCVPFTCCAFRQLDPRQVHAILIYMRGPYLIPRPRFVAAWESPAGKRLTPGSFRQGSLLTSMSKLGDLVIVP